MKTIKIISLSLIFLQTLFAQGTYYFNVELRPVPGANQFIGGLGSFTLSGNSFQGYATFDPPNRMNAVRIKNAAGTYFLPSHELLDLAPVVGVRGIWHETLLGEAEVSDLISGRWSLQVASVDFPNGALVGDFQLIPEPATWSFFIFGLLSIGFCRKLLT